MYVAMLFGGAPSFFGVVYLLSYYSVLVWLSSPKPRQSSIQMVQLQYSYMKGVLLHSIQQLRIKLCAVTPLVCVSGLHDVV